MLVFLTWAFEVAAATAIGGMVTGTALLAGLFLWAHTPRGADIGTAAPPQIVADQAARPDA